MNASAALQELAPKGVLRAAINFGNPVLAQPGVDGGPPRGVSVALARELAHRLGVDVEFILFDAAGKVVEALTRGAWDVAFLAIDPVRSAGIEFTAPYVLIEGTYIVRAGSVRHTISDFDQPGTQIAVGRGAAYDLFLSRTLKVASLVRTETSVGAVDLFVERGLDAAAGVRQPLQEYARRHPGFRIIEGRFTAIKQAVGTPIGRPAGAALLRSFVEEMKANGFVAAALAHSGQTEAAVAPATSDDLQEAQR